MSALRSRRSASPRPSWLRTIRQLADASFHILHEPDTPKFGAGILVRSRFRPILPFAGAVAELSISMHAATAGAAVSTQLQPGNPLGDCGHPTVGLHGASAPCGPGHMVSVTKSIGSLLGARNIQGNLPGHARSLAGLDGEPSRSKSGNIGADIPFIKPLAVHRSAGTFGGRDCLLTIARVLITNRV